MVPIGNMRFLPEIRDQHPWYVEDVSDVQPVKVSENVTEALMSKKELAIIILFLVQSKIIS
ncbi:hypothetical protein DGG96_18975 [Legionella qingyii]|uniref:Uncharacterized protein n=1 Tax=Legionella qingyii TaxID=2184757 RepID=A0A317TXA1_9GAMM|nr:hypothetical protein DGG96_18975 [Legionella qingyii]